MCFVSIIFVFIGGEYKEEFDLSLPKDIVPGSVYPTVSVIGTLFELSFYLSYASVCNYEWSNNELTFEHLEWSNNAFDIGLIWLENTEKVF